MKIVILDTLPLNIGDLSWEGLEKLGEVTLYEKTAPNEVYDRVKDADAIFTNKVVLNRELIERLEKCKFIGVLAAGYNVVDVIAAREKGIPVTNTPNYGSKSVAQVAFAHLLEITNRVGLHTESVKKGDWANCPVFSYWKKPVIDLEGLTVGVVGYGNIAKEFIKFAEVFGMNVIVHSKTKREGINWVSREELFQKADVISLHCPLTPDTKEMINRESIQLMKDGVIIVNTSRGALINEADLSEALNSGKVYGAGVDVLVDEPPKHDNALTNNGEVYITPHIGWASIRSRKNIIDIATSNLEEFVNGREKNIVN